MSTRRVVTYRTMDGDVLDAIAHKHLGSSEAVHALLRANPGLAGMGAVLPAGLLVQIPRVATASPRKKTVRLWGRSA